MKPIEHSQRKAIANAIKAQELKTSGEIYCVVARKSNEYDDIIMFYTALLALIVPSLFAIFNFDLVEFIKSSFGIWSHASNANPYAENIGFIISFQALIFIIGALLVKAPEPINFLIPKFIKRQRVHKAALHQFMAHGIHQTKDLTGVLIYVSLSEHLVEIIADYGIYTKVDKSVWREAIAKILLKTKDGELVAGLLDGIEAIGGILGEHFPPNADNENEISDSVVFI